MVANNYDFFNIFDFCLMLVKNYDLNFDEFITNCKAISYTSNFNK